jgi:CBS domain-containing protein
MAIFNMIPGFPLDGGRVLRAIVWWSTGNAGRSTRIAAGVGQFVALACIVVGILRFFGGLGFGGLWMAFIGWFLWDAARASYAQVEMVEGLRGVRVRDVMSRDCPTVDGHLTLQTFAEEHLLRTGRSCFVVDDGSIAGLITPHEVKELPRELWPTTTIAEAMRPLAELRTIRSDTPVAEALETMGR